MEPRLTVYASARRQRKRVRQRAASARRYKPILRALAGHLPRCASRRQLSGSRASRPVPSATVRDVNRGTACRPEPPRCASRRQGERDGAALWMGMAATEVHYEKSGYSQHGDTEPGRIARPYRWTVRQTPDQRCPLSGAKTPQERKYASAREAGYSRSQEERRSPGFAAWLTCANTAIIP
jgi:hypothetical protein